MKKTNKSYAKRVKITKNGTVLVRKPGINHFNAKESRVSQLKKHKKIALPMSVKARGRFLSNLG
jgi:ribosomal protein L35